MGFTCPFISLMGTILAECDAPLKMRSSGTYSPRLLPTVDRSSSVALHFARWVSLRQDSHSQECAHAVRTKQKRPGLRSGRFYCGICHVSDRFLLLLSSLPFFGRCRLHRELQTTTIV